jgi:hypothetical protein
VEQESTGPGEEAADRRDGEFESVGDLLVAVAGGLAE